MPAKFNLFKPMVFFSGVKSKEEAITVNSNFSFLAERFPALEKLGMLAEGYLYSDLNSCLFKTGVLAETIVNCMFDLDKMTPPGRENTHANRIKILQREGMLPKEIGEILYTLRTKRNDAVHEEFDSIEDCKTLLQMYHTLSVWFMHVYGDYTYETVDFVLPDDIQDNVYYQKGLEEDEPLPSEPEEQKSLYFSALIGETVQISERRKRTEKAIHNLKGSICGHIRYKR